MGPPFVDLQIAADMPAELFKPATQRPHQRVIGK
jgi:hypothetical protein